MQLMRTMVNINVKTYTKICLDIIGSNIKKKIVCIIIVNGRLLYTYPCIIHMLNILNLWQKNYYFLILDKKTKVLLKYIRWRIMSILHIMFNLQKILNNHLIKK